MLRATTILAISLSLVLAACGSKEPATPSDAVQNVPGENGVRENVK
jgi:hypothetical protein